MGSFVTEFAVFSCSGFLVRLIEGLATQDVGQAPARTCVAVQTDHEGRDQRSTSATPSVGEFRPPPLPFSGQTFCRLWQFSAFL